MDSIRTILLPTLLSLVLLACSDGKKSPSMGLDGTMPGQDSLGGDIGSDLQTMADDIGDALDDGSEDTDFSADQADIPTEDGVDVTHPQPCAEYPPGWLDG